MSGLDMDLEEKVDVGDIVGLVEFNALCALVFAGLLLLWNANRKRNFPPGPFSLPLVGHLPFLTKSVPQQLTKFAEKYGNVYSIKFGTERFIMLCDYNVIYEAFVKRSDVFSDRQVPKPLRQFGAHKGIIWREYGGAWKRLRKFGVTTLKGFGMGKRSMEERVNEETRYLLEAMRAEQGKAFDVQHVLNNAVSNIICSVVTGSRYDYNDKKFQMLLQLLSERFSGKETAKRMSYMTRMPLLKYIPAFTKTLNNVARQIHFTKQMFDEVIDEHSKTHDPENSRDIIDAFINEMQHDRNRTAFTRSNLDTYIRDMFNAGTETTATTLRWCFLYLAAHPDLQERMREEIILACGNNGFISMNNRESMPLTCSFIHEIQRTTPIIPLVPRQTSKNVQFRGFTIPKGTMIIANIWGVHHDPAVFGNPEKFNPERFIDENRNFSKHEHVIPYSVGARYCMGMHLAEMEVFIFLTGVLRNFRIKEDTANPLPSFHDGVTGLVHSPLPFKVVLELTT